MRRECRRQHLRAKTASRGPFIRCDFLGIRLVVKSGHSATVRLTEHINEFKKQRRAPGCLLLFGVRIKAAHDEHADSIMTMQAAPR